MIPTHAIFLKKTVLTLATHYNDEPKKITQYFFHAWNETGEAIFQIGEPQFNKIKQDFKLKLTETLEPPFNHTMGQQSVSEIYSLGNS